MAQDSPASVFHVVAVGEISCIEFPSLDNCYCGYKIEYGKDWTVTAGLEEGLSQTAVKSYDDHGRFVLNFPINITLKSTNPHGWPQLVVTVYGADFFGRDIVRGYTSAFFPTTPGRHTIKAKLFVPRNATLLHRYMSWFNGKRPEFVDSTIVTRSTGREVVRTESNGAAHIHMELAFKDMNKFGFVNERR